MTQRLHRSLCHNDAISHTTTNTFKGVQQALRTTDRSFKPSGRGPFLWSK
ncbi:hypothetical protein DSUL_20488 [Desulfovibrionales bacterium]